MCLLANDEAFTNEGCNNEDSVPDNNEDSIPDNNEDSSSQFLNIELLVNERTLRTRDDEQIYVDMNGMLDEEDVWMR